MSKSETITLRVSTETKRLFEKTASARGVSITELLLGLISDGAALERQRRERLRANVQDFVNKI